MSGEIERLIKINRNLSCVQYKTDHGAQVFHATTRDYKSDLLIKVSNTNGELQGCIPCDKAMVVEFSAQIASKFKDSAGTTWKKEEDLGMSVYNLTLDIEPQTVCDFFKSIYDGEMVLNNKCALPFHELSTFLCCDEDLICEIADYVVKNVTDETLVATWNADSRCRGLAFRQACIRYVCDSVVDTQILLKYIGILSVESFVEFLNETSVVIEGIFKSGELISLMKAWLKTNPEKHNHEALILESEFCGVSDKDKFEFYRDVMKDMDGELAKRVFEHMFSTRTEDFNIDDEITVILKASDLTDDKLEQILKNPIVVSSKIKTSINYFKNERSDERKKRAQKIKYNNFVGKTGKCIFTEKSAESGPRDENDEQKTIFSRSVDLSDGLISWKIRADALVYDNTELQSKYFGIGTEDRHIDVFLFIDVRNHIPFKKFMIKRNEPGNNKDHTVTEKNYGVNQLSTGDVLEIKFDQTQHTLEFLINGKSQGIAFDNIPKTKYRLMIRLGQIGDRITLLDE